MTCPPPRADTVVVGGGIVGLAVARELALRKPQSTVVVLEREAELGRHQTSHNSGVVHSGVYYTPGSSKARLCVEGARELRRYCTERGLPFEPVGKLIVARGEVERGRLAEIERRGREDRVPGLRRLEGGAAIAAVEPRARGVCALHLPETAITDFAAVADSYASTFRTPAVPCSPLAPCTAATSTPAARRSAIPTAPRRPAA